MNQRKFPKALRKDEDMEGSLSEEEENRYIFNNEEELKTVCYFCL
jgi:hypothetical protein